MKLVMLVISILLALSNCEGQQVCISGSRRTIGENVTTSSDTMGTVCQNSEKCVLTTINYKLGGLPAKLEYSSCFNTFMSSLSCSALARSFGISVESTCAKKSCSTFACNQFALVNGCDAGAPAGDIQILPNSTLKGIMNQMNECQKPLMAGYPYTDMTTCTGNIDSSFRCIRDTTMSCLSGNCPTVLDALPVPLQQYYSQIKMQLQTMTSFSAALTGLRANKAIIDQSLKSTCLIMGDDYSQLLQSLSFEQLLASMNIDTAQLELSVQNPVCDSKALIQLFRKAFSELKQLYADTDHTSFCRTLTNLWNDVSDTWKNHCNKTAVLELLHPLVPSAYSPLYPQILKAIDIVEQELFNSVEIPGCEGVAIPRSRQVPPLERPRPFRKQPVQREETFGKI